MKKLETAVLAVVLGAVPVIAGFVAGWWASIPLVPESTIWWFAAAGLACGVTVDALFLRGWIRRAWSMNTGIWMVIYGFYSVGMLGFFMGAPVFHVVLALPAGLFVGRRLALGGAAAAAVNRAARNAARFTVSVLTVVCLISASLALASPSTPSDLRGLLALPFAVTWPMVLILIVGGGASLLTIDWWLTIRCVNLSYRCSVRSESLPPQ